MAEDLTTALIRFTNWLRADGAGANRTIKARLCVVNACANFNDVDPRALTRDHITAYLGRPDLSRNSRHSYWGHLRSWTRWLIETEQIHHDPMLRMRRPRAAKGRPSPVPDHIINALLEDARGHTRAYLYLALFAGLRVAEIARVRGSDITEHSMTVTGKGGSTWVIPTHPAVWGLAQNYPQRGFWFPSRTDRGHVHGSSVGQALARLMRNAGYDGHAHQLRHTFGTNVLKASGGQLRIAQELLRHQSPAYTAIYCAVDDSERRAAVMSLPGWAA